MIVSTLFNSAFLGIVAAFIIEIYRKAKPGQFYEIGKKLMCQSIHESQNDRDNNNQRGQIQFRSMKNNCALIQDEKGDKNLNKTKKILKRKQSINKNPSKAYREWFLQHKQAKSNTILNLLNDNSFGKQSSEESLNLFQEQELQYAEDLANKQLQLAMYNPFVIKHQRKLFQFTETKIKKL